MQKTPIAPATVDRAAFAVDPGPEAMARALWNRVVWFAEVQRQVAAAVPDSPQARRTSGAGSKQWPPPAVAANIADVIRCIRAHESGRFDEHSHPWSGSGADQWIPSSWAEWSVRAGYGTRDPRGRPVPTYSLAYLAPPAVQDAVTAYALTHGGAGNWSMNYGNDPCTAGL